MAVITPKDELRAVNQILENAGDVSVNSLTGALPLEASKARAVIREVSEEVHERGL